MVLDDYPAPDRLMRARTMLARTMIARVRRHPFLVLSIVLHALPLAVLATLGSQRIEHAERDRQQRAVDAGRRLTQQARLEKRVHDMARIQSLLEKGTGAGADDVRFSEEPRSPESLLEDARTLARKIDEATRDAKAEQLAKLLGIPKEKALQQIPAPPKPPEAAAAASNNAANNAANAAAQIERLEAKAREALAQRRQQLAQRRGGTPVAPGSGPGKQEGQGGQGQAGRGHGNTNGAPDPSLLNRIDAFANPDLPDLATQAYTRGGLGSLYTSGASWIPGVGSGPVVTGSGRMIGAGGAFANRVYVNRWYLIGPFEGKHGAALFDNYHHAPEQGVALDAVYRGKGGRLLRWEYVDMAQYPLMPPAHAEDAVYYGYTELMMEEERDLTIWVGADDDVQLWLNDRLVWGGGSAGKQSFIGAVYSTFNTYVRDYNLTEGRRRVHVRKGRNKLFFKLSNGPTRIFFSLVLTT
jgi:hypothetical protein